MPDITCDCQEFLDLGQGDSEEHAMLLCNYFNYIDIENGRQHKKDGPKDGKDLHSYIVYGEAVPDGCAWFVARIDNNSSSDKHTCELWNPMTAECYNFDKISQNTQ